MTDTRTESDSMGPMEVPAEALYGPQTARAVANFPVSGWAMPRAFLAAVGLVKWAAAAAHGQAGRLDQPVARAIQQACEEVIAGRLDGHFPVDVFQTGSGTSTNMNVNEVIARRARQILAGGAGAEETAIHPNDHVNMGQSSNDVIPTALHLSAALALRDDVGPALDRLADALADRADALDHVVKIGRTHLQDAVPVRLGQELAGHAAQIRAARGALNPALRELCELPIGGTAVGTGLNAPEDFGADVVGRLTGRTGLALCPPSNRFAAQGARDAAVRASGALRSAALAMGKVASDIRLLASGPRCGLGELRLPAVQPGSSIMPGKVNPVLCETVVQVACQVIGCDAAIAAGATGGVGSILELNVAMPMIAWNLLTACRLIARAADAFACKCIAGLTADESRCEDLIERSLAMVTALAPRIGYDRAAELAKRAHQTGRTIRALCLAEQVLPADELDSLLDARGQTGR